jgi:hypothetical protein
MAVTEATTVKKPKTRSARPSSPSSPSVQEIEKALGLDKIRPIALSPATQRDLEEKGDPFGDWYEEELREFYRKARG